MAALPALRWSAAWRLTFVGIFLLVNPTCLLAQTSLKKVRVSIPAPNVTYLPFYAAKEHGYYKDEGLDVEFILMSANLASTAVLTGDLDYNGAVTGVVVVIGSPRPVAADARCRR